MVIGVDHRLVVHRRVNRGDRHIIQANRLIQQAQQRHAAVGGAGGVGHQQVHVAGAGAHGFPGGYIEACTKDELHRRGQGELHPGGQHPVQAEGFHQHRQHQRQRQGDGEQQRPALAVQALGLIDFGGSFALRQAGGVAGFVDGGDQYAGVHLAEHFDVGAFVGQVDAEIPKEAMKLVSIRLLSHPVDSRRCEEMKPKSELPLKR